MFSQGLLSNDDRKPVVQQVIFCLRQCKPLSVRCSKGTFSQPDSTGSQALAGARPTAYRFTMSIHHLWLGKKFKELFQWTLGLEILLYKQVPAAQSCGSEYVSICCCSSIISGGSLIWPHTWLLLACVFLEGTANSFYTLPAPFFFLNNFFFLLLEYLIQITKANILQTLFWKWSQHFRLIFKRQEYNEKLWTLLLTLGSFLMLWIWS